MAVRPTDGRPVAAVPGWLYYTSAGLAAVIVVCVATLVYLFATHTDASASGGDRLRDLFGGTSSGQQQAQDVASQRDAAEQVGSQFVLRINTYGPHDLNQQNKMPGYVERVDALSSAKLQASFEQGVVLAEKSVAQAGLARSATVYTSAVSQMDADQATVLVAGTIAQSYPNPQAPKDPKKRVHYQPDPIRVSLSMVKLGDTWKVDNFCFITDTDSPTQCASGSSGSGLAGDGSTGSSGGATTPSGQSPQSGPSARASRASR